MSGGVRGSLVAAGHERKHHDQSEQDTQESFHAEPPISFFAMYYQGVLLLYTKIFTLSMTEIKQYSAKRCKKDCGTCGDGAIPHSNGEPSLKNPNEVHSVHGMKEKIIAYPLPK